MKARSFNFSLMLALVFASTVLILGLLPLLMAGPMAYDSQAAQKPSIARVAPLAQPSPPAPGCGSDLSYGANSSDSISYPTSICEYRFSGTAGDVVTIAMNKQDANLDPYLDLRAPDGNVVVSNDDSGGNGNSLISNYTLGQGGPYVILAHSWNYASTGSYTVSLTKSTSGGCGGKISYGTPVTGNVPLGNRCFYTFQGQAGRVITITMNKQSNSLDPYLRLKNPAGQWVKSDDDSGGSHNALIKSFQLKKAGTWTVAAGSYNGASSGPFTLSLN